MVVIIAFALLWTLVCSYTMGECPKGVKDRYTQAYGNTTKCYRFVVYANVDFQTAKDYCVGKGGTLATVESREVNEFITKQLRDDYKYYGTAWIGLTYDKGAFKQMDGSPAMYNNSVSLGEGSDGVTPLGKCVAMDTATLNGVWQIYNCTNSGNSWNQMAFVCEFPQTVEKTTQPTAAATTTSSCQDLTCNLDCGLDGFRKDENTGCLICECDSFWVK